MVVFGGISRPDLLFCHSRHRFPHLVDLPTITRCYDLLALTRRQYVLHIRFRPAPGRDLQLRLNTF